MSSLAAEETAIGERDPLVRFLTQGRWIRENGTVRPEAFLPEPKSQELSVTRRRSLNEDRIWAIGRAVAHQFAATLHGRSDLLAGAFIAEKLTVLATPVANNPNHASVRGWPSEKGAQKSVAQAIAATVGTAIRPPLR